MSIYGELYSTQEHRTKLAFEGKKKHIAEVNIPNLGYPIQYINIEMPHDSRYHVIVWNTVKLRLILTRKIQNTKRVVLLIILLQHWWKNETDVINNWYIYGTCKYLYLSEKKNLKRSCFKIYNQKKK